VGRKRSSPNVSQLRDEDEDKEATDCSSSLDGNSTHDSIFFFSLSLSLALSSSTSRALLHRTLGVRARIRGEVFFLTFSPSCVSSLNAHAREYLNNDEQRGECSDRFLFLSLSLSLSLSLLLTGGKFVFFLSLSTHESRVNDRYSTTTRTSSNRCNKRWKRQR